MINANIIHILILYTISYGSLIIPQIHFHIQYFTISNQFNYAHKFSSVLQFNLVLKINSVMQINSIMPINSVMQINSIMPINSVMPFDEFNICLRYTGYQNHRHGLAGLQAGITRFYNTVRSHWAADWL